jgi:hypothetical protein
VAWCCVPNRSSRKRPPDLNRPAADIVAATGDQKDAPESSGPDKNPAAVELGRAPLALGPTESSKTSSRATIPDVLVLLGWGEVLR